MTDTPPAFQANYRRRLMRRPPAERFLMGVSMHQTARALALASLPPDATPAETRRFLLHRFYPELDR